MTKDILDEARAMLEGVPEGPWVVIDSPAHRIWVRNKGGMIAQGPFPSPYDGQAARYAEEVAEYIAIHNFIAWSRTGVPALIERVAALEAENKQLREAVGDVLNVATDTYTARNGRRVSIQADDGEKCWIVHSDQIELLRGAIEVPAKGGSDAE